MCEEYNSVLSTPFEADKIGCFGRYRYIGKTLISTQYIGQADILVYLLFFSMLKPLKHVEKCEKIRQSR